MVIKINTFFYTDMHKFAEKPQNIISIFKDSTQDKLPHKLDLASSCNGSCNLDNNTVHINLEHIFNVTRVYQIDLLDFLYETIRHEILHLVISDIYPNAACCYQEKVIFKYFEPLKQRMISIQNEVIEYYKK